MASSIVTDSELEKYNVAQLKDFLRARNCRVTGLKKELQELAKLYKDNPTIQESSSSQPTESVAKSAALDRYTSPPRLRQCSEPRLAAAAAASFEGESCPREGDGYVRRSKH